MSILSRLFPSPSDRLTRKLRATERELEELRVRVSELEAELRVATYENERLWTLAERDRLRVLQERQEAAHGLVLSEHSPRDLSITEDRNDAV